MGWMEASEPYLPPDQIGLGEGDELGIGRNGGAAIGGPASVGV